MPQHETPVGSRVLWATSAAPRHTSLSCPRLYGLGQSVRHVFRRSPADVASQSATGGGGGGRLHTTAHHRWDACVLTASHSGVEALVVMLLAG